ncbi:hypothetical protein R6Q57_028403 [Mikania cordata]
MGGKLVVKNQQNPNQKWNDDLQENPNQKLDLERAIRITKEVYGCMWCERQRSDEDEAKAVARSKKTLTEKDNSVGFERISRHRQEENAYAIGILRVWGPIVDKSRLGQSCNREVRNMVISNESGLEVSVSLWGKLARQHVDDDLRAYGDGNIVLILTSCKVQLFKGISILKKYVSPPVVFKSHEYHSEDLRVTKVGELFSYLQEGVIEDTMYIIDATIFDVDLVNDWKYVKCSRCRKKTTLNSDRYFCASCDTVVVNPSQAYKLVIRVVDKGEELSCVLFDEAAFSLLGITVDELLTRSFSEGADDPYWIEDFLFDTLLGQRVILKIKIDRYNLAPNYVRRFTVSKYIGDDVKLLNKDKPMSTTCTSQALPSNYVSDGDVDDTIDDFPPITDDEWAMSDEAMWGPVLHHYRR